MKMKKILAMAVMGILALVSLLKQPLARKDFPEC